MESAQYTDGHIRELIETYSDMLIRISFTYMKNTYDAEDIAQGVFMKLIEKKPAFGSSEHEKAWLIRAVINDCKNQLRSAWFTRTEPLDENICETDREEKDVMKSVMKLPAKYRAIILLFYYEDYSISKIAGILGGKESTIGSQLCRARKMLKRKLGDYDDV